MKKKYILPLILILGMTPLIHAQSKKELKQIIKSQQEQLEQQNQRIDSLINVHQNLNQQFSNLQEQQTITIQQNQILNEEISELRDEIKREQAIRMEEQKRKMEEQRRKNAIREQEEQQRIKYEQQIIAYRKTFTDSNAKLKKLLSEESRNWEGVPSLTEVGNAIINTYNNKCNMGTVNSVEFVKWKNKNISQTPLQRTETYWVKWGTEPNGKPYGRDVRDDITTQRKRIQISIECPDKTIYEAYLSPVLVSVWENISSVYTKKDGSFDVGSSTRHR